MFRELCGDETLVNVILVTNMWGDVAQDVGEAREQELITTFFKPVLDKGAQITRHHNTAHSAHEIIRSIMKNRPVPLQIQRELVDEHKKVIDTAAGEAVNEELNKQMRRHQAELKAVQEDMMQALKDKDEETRRDLEEETRKLQEEMNKMRKDSEGMVSSYQQEKERMREAMQEMQEKARQEREQMEDTYRQQMDDLNRRLQESKNPVDAKAIWDRIKQLEHQWENRSRCLVM